VGELELKSTAPKKGKTVAVVLFVFAVLVWVATVAHDTLGFVAPRNAEAVGFDLFTGLVWLLLIFASRGLYVAFWK
jgi:hypothetical protein